MLKIVTIVGARPQFIKAAALSREIGSDRWNKTFNEVIIHTGQHYDANMSDLFFDEMGIPVPDYHLQVGSGTHGKMTGEMLIRIEEVLMKENPDFVLVYGDTNSTLAGALAASKLNIPLAHVEAGLRSFWKRMPEEQNRVLTDHVSDYLFVPVQNAVKNLANEGITRNVFQVGDIMLDAFNYYSEVLDKKYPDRLQQIQSREKIPTNFFSEGFFLLTVHRAENTDNPENLSEIISALNNTGKNALFPVHPRTKKILKSLNIKFGKQIKLIEPIGYFDMLALEKACDFIVTDSGGVQKEAYFAHKPCITLREQTEWVETVESGWNHLTGTSAEKIRVTMEQLVSPDHYSENYGTGNTSAKILTTLKSNG
jgi:UDP-GlcNAc3NAcA epimerase